MAPQGVALLMWRCGDRGPPVDQASSVPLLARLRELEDGLDARTAEMLGMRRAATEAAADAATQGGAAEEGETEEDATEGLDGAARGGGAPQGSAADAALEHTSLWRIPAVR